MFLSDSMISVFLWLVLVVMFHPSQIHQATVVLSRLPKSSCRHEGQHPAPSEQFPPAAASLPRCPMLSLQSLPNASSQNPSSSKGFYFCSDLSVIMFCSAVDRNPFSCTAQVLKNVCKTKSGICHWLDLSHSASLSWGPPLRGNSRPGSWQLQLDAGFKHLNRSEMKHRTTNCINMQFFSTWVEINRSLWQCAGANVNHVENILHIFWENNAPPTSSTTTHVQRVLRCQTPKPQAPSPPQKLASSHGAQGLLGPVETTTDMVQELNSWVFGRKHEKTIENCSML